MLRLSKDLKVFREYTAYSAGRKAHRHSTRTRELHTNMRLKVHTGTAFPLACGGRAGPRREHLHDLRDQENDPGMGRRDGPVRSRRKQEQITRK